MDSFEKPARPVWQNALISSAISALAVIAPACSYGDPCLRTTDCGSGLICEEGKCIVDPGDTPSDGAPPTDVVVSSDTTSSDTSTRDTTSISDSSSDAVTPPADSASDAASDSATDPAVDTPRDGADGDSASLDTGADGTDARASVDASSDTTGGDVGNDADAGIASDARADATDAAG